MDITLENSSITGVISASRAKHRSEVITTATFPQEEGLVTNTPSPVVNNGVLLTLDENSVWTVTGKSFLSALTIAPGAQILAADKKQLSMTVNGEKQSPVAGSYYGDICLQIL